MGHLTAGRAALIVRVNLVEPLPAWLPLRLDSPGSQLGLAPHS